MQRKKTQIIQFKQLLIKISFERARLFIVPISQGVGNTVKSQLKVRVSC